MKNNIINALKVSVLAVVISFGLSYALAWTAPTAIPPGGNVSAPINTSGTAQTKTGALTVGSITTAGAVTAGSLKITTGAGANKVLTSDAQGNATWQDTQVYTPGSMAYTTPGTYTFTVPPLTTTLNMEVWGAGGGSGSNTYGIDTVDSLPYYTGGGGGGSGGRDKQTIVVTPGQTLTIEVGAGGAGGIAQAGWPYSFPVPAQTYGATGGQSYVYSNPVYYARAYGGSGGRNWNFNNVIYVVCSLSPYSAPGGTALIANGNPGANCTNATTGSAGGAALAGTNPINSTAAGKGGGPTPAGNFPGLKGGDGKVVLWW